MESRRRLGKRHMTAIMPDSRASPLPWNIEFPFSVDKWTWQAPSTPEERSSSSEKARRPGALEKFICWLENAGNEDLPFNDSATEDAVASDTLPASLYDTLEDGMNEKVLAILKTNGKVQTKDLIFATQHYLDGVLEMIRSRQITTVELTRTIQPFDDSVKVLFPSVGMRDYVLATHLEKIIETIHDSRITPLHDAYGFSFWHRLSYTISCMTPHNQTLLAFRMLCRKGKTERTTFITSPHLHRLFQNSLDFGWRDAHRHSKFNSRYEVLCDGLEAITQGLRRRDIYMEGIRHCARQREHKRQRYFSSLLQLAAFQRSISTVEFAQMVNDTRQFVGPIPHDQAVQLAHARLYVKATSIPTKDDNYKQILKEGNWSGLVEFATATNHSRRMQNLRVLTETCHALGHLKEFLAAVAQQQLSEDYLKDIIRSCHSHHVALAAWHAANPQYPDQFAWEWWVWIRHAEAIIKDPTLPSTTLFHVAYLLPTKNVVSEKIPFFDEVHGIKTRRRLLEKMAAWFTEVKHLSDRVVLRRMETILSFHKAGGKPLTNQVINPLATVILRDMERGESGRLQRLKRLVDLVREHLGPEQADIIANQLEGWRQTVMSHQTPWALVPTVHGTEDTGKSVDELRTKGHAVSDNLKRMIAGDSVEAVHTNVFGNDTFKPKDDPRFLQTYMKERLPRIQGRKYMPWNKLEAERAKYEQAESQHSGLEKSELQKILPKKVRITANGVEFNEEVDISLVMRRNRKTFTPTVMRRHKNKIHPSPTII